MKLFAIIVAAILTAAAIMLTAYGFYRYHQQERAAWDNGLNSAIESVRIVETWNTDGRQDQKLKQAIESLRVALDRADTKGSTAVIERARRVLTEYEPKSPPRKPTPESRK